MAVRAIRGATQLPADTKAAMAIAVPELVAEVFSRNGISQQDVISMLFTSTPDLVSGFPATAARQMGLAEVPLMCAQEIAVPGSLPRVVRVMMHVDVDLSRHEIEHVFLHGASSLREDLTGD